MSTATEEPVLVKIRISTSRSGVDHAGVPFSYVKGDEPFVESNEAKRWVDAGTAVYVDEPPAAKPTKPAKPAAP